VSGKLIAVRRARMVALLASAAGAALIIGVIGMTALPSSASALPGKAIPAAAAHRLRTDVIRIARFNGDAHPVSIRAVATTEAKALVTATPGDTVPGSASQPAYLVVMKGHFKLTHASVPPGARIPTGRYLSLTINPSTMQVMDLGLRNAPPPHASLRTYGPVSDLTTQR